jgi:HemK-like putative methylase
MTRVDFAEIDTRHHGTIVDNVCDNGLDYTLARVFGGDLFSEIPRGTRYDAILSNPPYIDPALDRAEPSVKKYEPANALYGGKDGMELITRIINDAHAYLSQNGTLWVEHEPEQAVRIAELGASAGFTVNTQNDQFGISRFSILSL